MQRTIADIIAALRHCRSKQRGCSLLIGAGCSVSAGIPTAQGFIEIIEERFAEAHARADPKTYPKCMSELDVGIRRDLIAEYVDNAKVNWAHLSIAQLVKEGYVDRVLTTNFDPLIVRACALVGEFPAVYDFAASQTFKPAYVPDKAVFHLHGQRAGFILLNTVEEVASLRTQAKELLRDAGEGRVWVIVGYSGANDPVIEQLAQQESFDYGLYWVGYRDASPPDHIRELLITGKKTAYYVGPHDADDFFVKLCQGLRIFPPAFVHKPFSYLRDILGTLTRYRIPGQEQDIDVADGSRRTIGRLVEEEEPRLQAEHHLMAGQYDRVIALWKDAKSKDDPELQSTTAWAYTAQGDILLDQARGKSGAEADRLYAAAYEEYEAALKIKPDMDAALNNWGNALLNQARGKSGAEADRLYVAAYEKYAAALKIKPEMHQALYNWGNALFDQARGKSGVEADRLYAAAYEKYEAALKIKPDKHGALNNWGIALSDQARGETGAEADRLYAAAYVKFEAALKIKSDMHEALHNWGLALFRQARGESGAEADRLYAAAYEKYAAALKIKPDKHDALYSWGIALSVQARGRSDAEADRLYAAAYEKYEAALKITPDKHGALNNWGLALLDQARGKSEPQAGRILEEAHGKFIQVETAKPGSAAYELACVAALRGKEVECQQWLERSQRHGRLPSRDDIQKDTDLASVRDHPWFKAFLAKLDGEPSRPGRTFGRT